jgi:hypothetical protein
VTLTSSTSARAATEHAANKLDAALFDPLRQLLADRLLVVVPTGVLNAMPWSALPTCARRPYCVAPSAAAWLRASRRSPPAGPAVLVAGPRLPVAEDEVTAVRATLPTARLLLGAQATAGSGPTAPCSPRSSWPTVR